MQHNRIHQKQGYWSQTALTDFKMQFVDDILCLQGTRHYEKNNNSFMHSWQEKKKNQPIKQNTKKILQQRTVTTDMGQIQDLFSRCLKFQFPTLQHPIKSSFYQDLSSF